MSIHIWTKVTEYLHVETVHRKMLLPSLFSFFLFSYVSFNEVLDDSNTKYVFQLRFWFVKSLLRLKGSLHFFFLFFCVNSLVLGQMSFDR